MTNHNEVWRSQWQPTEIITFIRFFPVQSSGIDDLDLASFSLNVVINLLKFHIVKKATDEKTGSKCTSTTLSAGRYYYLTVAELDNADCNGFKHLSEKLTKECLLGLLMDIIGHLRKAKSSVYNLSEIIDENDYINQTLDKNDDLNNGASGLNEIKCCPITTSSCT